MVESNLYGHPTPKATNKENSFSKGLQKTISEKETTVFDKYFTENVIVSKIFVRLKGKHNALK
jgi:hypothetical protein